MSTRRRRRGYPSLGVINMSGWWVEPYGDLRCVVARDEYGNIVGRYNPAQASIVTYESWLSALDRLHQRRKRPRAHR